MNDGVASGTAQTVDLSARCGSHTLNPADEGLQVLAFRYELRGLLGCGGMGQVFKALDRQRHDLAESDRYVAIKILRQDEREAKKRLAELRREFYCAQSLSHPNIVNVHELAFDGDLAFFTMELLEGETLSDRLARTHPTPPSREFAWRVIRDVGAGVAHAHSRDVVHGDLKPHNIMITRQGEVRILDFGASGSLRRTRIEPQDALQRAPIPAVTPAYACCELIEGQRADPRDDLFSLACLSYELLTGLHPFQGHNSVTARQNKIEPAKPEGLTAHQWQTLRQGLAWRRDDRELPVSEWLEQLTPKSPGVWRWPSTPASLRRVAPERLRFGATAGIAAVLLLAGVALYSGRTHPPQSTPAVAQSSVSRAPTALAAVSTPPPVSAAIAQPTPPAVPSAPPIILRAPAPNTVRVASVSVLPGAGFVQVKIARTSANGRTQFSWWTEGSTAHAGSDFVAQAPTMQQFSKGRLTTDVFIRLLPNQSRKGRQTFYVAIGGGPSALAREFARRTAVSIPAAEGMVASNLR